MQSTNMNRTKRAGVTIRAIVPTILKVSSKLLLLRANFHASCQAELFFIAPPTTFIFLIKNFYDTKNLKAL